MFPDRVGRVILDGVMDPTTYSQGRPDMGWAADVESTDEAFIGFVNGCEVAGAAGCAIADESVSGNMDLLTWAQNLTEVRCRHCPYIHVPCYLLIVFCLQWAYDMHKADPQTYYSALDVRSTIFSAMYAPKQWADFANGDLLQLWSSYASPDILDTKRKRDLARRDDTGLVSHPVWRRQYNDAPSQALEAITCGDAPDLKDVTTSSVFDEILRVTRDVSGFCMPFPFLSLFLFLLISFV